MSTSVGSSGIVYASVATRSLFLAVKIMMISIIYMFVTLSSHVHMSEVTNLLLVFCGLRWY